jgi:hypothetical protein
MFIAAVKTPVDDRTTKVRLGLLTTARGHVTQLRDNASTD